MILQTGTIRTVERVKSNAVHRSPYPLILENRLLVRVGLRELETILEK